MARRVRQGVLKIVSRVGVSRHGIAASAKSLRSRPLPRVSVRIIAVIVSSALIGMSIGAVVAADFGVAPYDVWLSALAERTPMTMGQAAWATSGTLFLAASIFGVRPKPFNIAFMLLNGIMVDAALEVFTTPTSLLARIGLAAFGFGALTAGVSLVVVVAATGGSFEAIMNAAESRGISRQRTRLTLEVGILTLGIVAGGSFGPMTVIIALLLAPSMTAALQALHDHRAGRRARLASRAEADALLV